MSVLRDGRLIGRPVLPDHESNARLADFLSYKRELHLHRQRYSYAREGNPHRWVMVYQRSPRCGTDQCFKKPLNVT